MKEITAQEYLNSIGIDLKKTCLITVLEDCIRQPDLCVLMELYAEIKCKNQSPVKKTTLKNQDNLKFKNYSVNQKNNRQ